MNLHETNKEIKSHPIKVSRACAIAGKLPRAQAEILSSIPTALVDRLTASELAMVMNALDTHWHKARAFESREILAEGFIYDPAQNKIRELAA